MNRRRHGAEDGDRARAHNFWLDAIRHYERYLERYPADIGVRIRLANTLRESGDLTTAIAVLREAVARRPEKLEIRRILAVVLDEAGLIEEARLALPTEGNQLQVLEQVGASPPPAPDCESQKVHIFVEVAKGEDEELAATVASLRKLNVTRWWATIWGEGRDICALEGPAATDIYLLSGADEVRRIPLRAPVLTIRAGTVFRQECLDWLLWALDEDVDAVYCDHEAGVAPGVTFAALQSAPHPLDLQTNPVPPAIILSRWLADGDPTDQLGARRRLHQAFECGVVRHIPLVLASTSDVVPSASCDARTVSSDQNDERILVVIPTRDEGAALDKMLRSLFERASGDMIDVVVVDNGSREEATLDVFHHWQARGVEILRHDAPFNWSELNNLACQGRKQSIMVLANNDMEMLTEAWDSHVRSLLALDGVGVVGARLLYPNDRVQHAGIVMGALNGEPLHEGLRVAPDEGGPLDRWVRRRPATAVTGAFMAMRRSVFDAVGGFDAENFAVSCNDVDFCLRAGASGWTVLYAPELVLCHHESLSRGRSDTDAKLKRAAAEMSCLLERWGDNARFDPNRNPQWVGRGVRLFAGTQSLTAQQVIEWTIATEWRATDQIETPTLA